MDSLSKPLKRHESTKLTPKSSNESKSSIDLYGVSSPKAQEKEDAQSDSGFKALLEKIDGFNVILNDRPLGGNSFLDDFNNEFVKTPSPQLLTDAPVSL